MTTAVVKKDYSFSFSALDNQLIFCFDFARDARTKKKLKISSSKASKDCQILSFDFRVVDKNPKMSGKEAVSSDSYISSIQV